METRLTSTDHIGRLITYQGLEKLTFLVEPQYSSSSLFAKVGRTNAALCIWSTAKIVNQSASSQMTGNLMKDNSHYVGVEYLSRRNSMR